MRNYILFLINSISLQQWNAKTLVRVHYITRYSNVIESKRQTQFVSYASIIVRYRNSIIEQRTINIAHHGKEMMSKIEGKCNCSIQYVKYFWRIIRSDWESTYCRTMVALYAFHSIVNCAIMKSCNTFKYPKYNNNTTLTSNSCSPARCRSS